MSHNTQELMKNNTEQMEASDVRYKTLAEFYPFYLSQHENATCRRLHFVGTSCVIGIAAASIATGNAKLLWALPVVGYGFAWVGHFFYEHNKPATFKQPFFSLACDFIMYKDILLKRVKW
ncbi:Mpo1-like protein [Acinetobacter sp. HC8-3S]|uniref:DUF962 domain-containing protein n=1 Tax=Acinetobacter venetianus TaxID=52133 RepID=A0A150HST8_9GAMM|nr:DUF962 domain-containing protein [Acinetobacter venetianus]KXZ69673.1 hypothetical protein AVENLUH13518_02336 [Acinetobacter venetianus]